MISEVDFSQFYEEFKPKILRYLSRLTGQQESEDIAQEVFEKASRGLKSFKGKSKLSTWLYRIATNTAIDKMRSPSFRCSSEHTSLEEDTGTEDRNVWSGRTKAHVDQTGIQNEMSKCIREFIARLPSDYKTVILLRELDGFKNQEIADILQVSLDTVKIRLHRASAMLKKELDTGCTFYHSEEDILSCDRK